MTTLQVRVPGSAASGLGRDSTLDVRGEINHPDGRRELVTLDQHTGQVVVVDADGKAEQVQAWPLTYRVVDAVKAGGSFDLEGLASMQRRVAFVLSGAPGADRYRRKGLHPG